MVARARARARPPATGVPSARAPASARRGRPRINGSLRGWLTLLVLAVIVVAISLGPGAVRDLVAGLFFVRPSAGAIATPALHSDARLQTRLDSLVGTTGEGHVGVEVIELQTGATGSVEAERELAAASLFKLPILMEVLAQEDAGRLDDDLRLEIRPDDWTEGSGVLQARVGQRLSVGELLRLMIQQSDNIAALVLLDEVGLSDVNARAQQLGLPTTRLVDHRGGDTREHATSAADMAHLLVSLASGQAVNQRVSERALRLLELKQSVSWLTDALPPGVKLAHKWGELPGTRNDVGIVYTPRGNYVVAVLTEDLDAGKAAALIARTSRLVHDELGGGR